MSGRDDAELEVEVFAPPLEPRRVELLVARHWRRGLLATMTVGLAAVLCAASTSLVARGPLLGYRTGSLLWFFREPDRKLTRVDLDHGEVRVLPVYAGDDLLATQHGVAVVRSATGTDFIGRDGRRIRSGLRGAVITDPTTDTVWAQGDYDAAHDQHPWVRYEPPYVESTSPLDVEPGVPIGESGPRLLVETLTQHGVALDWIDSGTGATEHFGDGCFVATTRHGLVTCSAQPGGQPSSVSVRDPSRGTPPVTLFVEGLVFTATVSPDGKFVAVLDKVADETRIELFDAYTGAEVHQIAGSVVTWTWTRDNRYLIIADFNDLIAWRVRDGAITRLPFRAHASDGLALTA